MSQQNVPVESLGLSEEVRTEHTNALSDMHTPTWEQIVIEHSARVYRLAFRLTGNQYDAEDLTQEVFIRVFRSLHNFQPGSFEGWLHRITTNVFLDQVRRKKRIRMDQMGEEAATFADPNEFLSPERGYEHNNLDYDIQEALRKLSPEYRVAVVLCDIEGLSYEEIAATLGIKLGTVRSRIHRARAQLKKSLAHRDPARFKNTSNKERLELGVDFEQNESTQLVNSQIGEAGVQ